MNRNTHATPPAANASAPDSAALFAELDAQKDRYLRLAADFDNFRKRTTHEAERRAAAQKEAFIRELLPVIDNLERALTSNAAAPEQLRQGVQMTFQQLDKLLRRHGIEPEDSIGQPFDPHRHEALRVLHDPTQPDQTVLDVFERGYRRRNETFRPAKVIVNQLSPKGASDRRS
jgi:molecular chaperone GrpE